MRNGQARILMCRPDFFGIEYEINPWMHKEKNADRSLAIRQWEGLVEILTGLGAKIELVAPVEGLPDMVFTANAGIVVNDLFITSWFRHKERQGESAYFEKWMAEHGFRAAGLPVRAAFEGAGDALFCGDNLFAAYIYRSEIRAHHALAECLGCRVLSLELVDPRFYHLDTCFCPLAHDTAIYYPPAFDEYGRRVLVESIPHLIPVGDADAVRFGCNAVVVGKNVVLNAGCDGLADLLIQQGFVPYMTPLDEFLKSGGSAKCLTLRLDGEEAAGWKRQ